MLAEGSFAGKVAIVTGGGSGIGRGIAEELARLGSDVAVLGRSQDKLDQTCQDLKHLPGKVVGYGVDIRERESVVRAVDDVLEEFGKVDHLVNNAAGNFRVAPEKMSPNAWRAVVATVLDGTWNCTQLIGQHLIGRESPGSILNIGSTMSMYGGPDTVHSASAKAGVLTMTKSLGAAWGRYGIRINVLIPGITEGTAGVDILLADPEHREAALAQVPLGRAVNRAELAAVASFLLSDHAAYITGATLVMDGGRSLATL